MFCVEICKNDNPQALPSTDFTLQEIQPGALKDCKPIMCNGRYTVSWAIPFEIFPPSVEALGIDYHKGTGGGNKWILDEELCRTR